MNKLSIQKRSQIIGRFVEGNSMRATSRLANWKFGPRYDLSAVEHAKCDDDSVKNSAQSC